MFVISTRHSEHKFEDVRVNVCDHAIELTLRVVAPGLFV